MQLQINHHHILDTKKCLSQLVMLLNASSVKAKEINIIHYSQLILISQLHNLFGILEMREILKVLSAFLKLKHLLHFKFQDWIQSLLFKILTSCLNIYKLITIK